MIDRRQLRQEGKNIVKKEVFKYFFLLFIYGLISGGVETFFEEMAKATGKSIFNSMSVLLLVLAPLSIGCSYIFLTKVRQRDYEIKFGDAFKYYKSWNYIFNMIAVRFLVNVIVTIGFILLIVPGILWSIDLSQCNYIMADSPDKDPFDVLKESRALMKNRRGEFFMLVLSYIPHVLLGIITLGIYFIWLAPYMASTFALYYNTITTPETSVDYSDNQDVIEMNEEKTEETVEENGQETDGESSGDETV